MKSDSSAGHATDTVYGDHFAELCSWTGIRRCDHKTSGEMTDLFVNLWGNEKTRDHWKNQLELSQLIILYKMCKY